MTIEANENNNSLNSPIMKLLSEKPENLIKPKKKIVFLGINVVYVGAAYDRAHGNRSIEQRKNLKDHPKILGKIPPEILESLNHNDLSCILGFSERALENVRKLCDAHDAEVVFISSWGPDSLPQLKGLFSVYNLNGYINDRMPPFESKSKWIKTFLRKNIEIIESFVILGDTKYLFGKFGKRFVYCDSLFSDDFLLEQASTVLSLDLGRLSIYLDETHEEIVLKTRHECYLEFIDKCVEKSSQRIDFNETNEIGVLKAYLLKFLSGDKSPVEISKFLRVLIDILSTSLSVTGVQEKLFRQFEWFSSNLEESFLLNEKINEILNKGLVKKLLENFLHLFAMMISDENVINLFSKIQMKGIYMQIIESTIRYCGENKVVPVNLKGSFWDNQNTIGNAGLAEEGLQSIKDSPQGLAMRQNN